MNLSRKRKRPVVFPYSLFPTPHSLCILCRMPSKSASSSDLCFLNAVDLAALIQARTVSAREVMAAHLARIHQLNPKLNAIVAMLDDDQCLSLADAADQRAARGAALPPHRGCSGMRGCG